MKNNEVLRELEKSIELEGKSKGTLERYTSNIKKLMEYYPNREISKLSEEELREYAFYLHRRRYAETTYNNHIAAIRYVYRNVIFKQINVRKIPLKRTKKKEIMIPSKEEVIEIINRCKETELRLAVLLAVTSGMRISEIVRIKGKEINAIKKEIYIEKGKGKKERITIIEEMVIKEARRYWVEEREKIEGNEYLFAKKNYEGHIKSDKISRELRKKTKYTMHNLRHYFATEVYMQTKDVEYVREIMGHELIETTKKYIHNKEKEYKIKSSVVEILSEGTEQCK